MCGIYGFSGNKPVDIEKFKILMLFNEHRGGDSVGYSDGKFVLKQIGNAVKFITDNNLSNLAGKFSCIGHNRKKTVGIVSDKTAHPFDIGQIIGVHNGTLNNHIALSTKMSVSIDVDSEILFHVLDRDGVESLSEVTGAAAIAWFDKREPHNLFLLRNKERPLFIGEASEGVYFSSLEESLLAIGCTKVEQTEVDVLYIIRKGSVFKVPKKIEIEPYARTVIRGSYGYPTRSYDDWDTDLKGNYSGYSPSKSSPETKVEKSSENINAQTKPDKPIDDIPYEKYSNYEGILCDALPIISFVANCLEYPNISDDLIMQFSDNAAAVEKSILNSLEYTQRFS